MSTIKFTGEYRETIWGYKPQPITGMGTFTFQWVGERYANAHLRF